MTDLQMIIIIFVLALGVAITRFLPFLVFSKKGKTPAFIEYLGKVLPASMMGLLVIYCFKDVNFLEWRELVPCLVASAVTVGAHLWKKKTVLSIVLGTAVYMLLIRIL